ncbi:MAG: hypothetical protein EBV15_03705 [Bacteroidetes bacterium]|jgi:hypothetical protein|nr:hypothetical protein [Bacteroidota bacterium]
MENNTLDNNFGNAQGAVALPNSTAVLVLGILSLVMCFCYGIIGLILGIIGLSMAGKDLQRYKMNPNAYTISSYNNLKAGRVCSIIGIILSGLYFIIIIIYLIAVGSMISMGSLGGF